MERVVTSLFTLSFTYKMGMDRLASLSILSLSWKDDGKGWAGLPVHLDFHKQDGKGFLYLETHIQDENVLPDLTFHLVSHTRLNRMTWSPFSPCKWDMTRSPFLPCFSYTRWKGTSVLIYLAFHGWKMGRIGLASLLIMLLIHDMERDDLSCLFIL